ncbi:MAG: tRNA (adenosine(37)-N6)-threonylcarbamoyltransferase complex transferase subunit TsaD [Alphaproteobacteria bacterium]
MIILGIEASCDETAVAIIDNAKNVYSHIVLSSLKEHQKYGGVVPEIAARAHLNYLDGLVVQALEEAKLTFKDLSAVAATGGPGLIGGVMVGMMGAKTISYACNIPLIAVNHLEGHALTPRLTNDIDFPFLLLLVSGGHCQILICEGVGKYHLLGTTIDDAIGEVYDKFARMLGLGYPGGPAIEKLAQKGDRKKFELPRPLKGRPNCDFSFSGLKTKLRQTIENLGEDITEQDKADLSASFEMAVADCLDDRLKRAIKIAKEQFPQISTLVVAGGVAANQYLNARLQGFAKKNDMSVVAPPLELCTDNGAMIAWAGVERYQAGFFDDLSFKPRPRWPL